MQFNDYYSVLHQNYDKLNFKNNINTTYHFHPLFYLFILLFLFCEIIYCNFIRVHISYFNEPHEYFVWVVLLNKFKNTVLITWFKRHCLLEC